MVELRRDPEAPVEAGMASDLAAAVEEPDLAGRAPGPSPASSPPVARRPLADRRSLGSSPT